MKINNGCPDKDGITDKNNECPEAPGLKKFKDCPDTDGLQDKFDDCIEEWGPITNKGCSEFLGQGKDTVYITIRDTVYLIRDITDNKALFEVFENIQFDHNKHTLTTTSEDILDRVFMYLTTKSALMIRLTGHTDDVDTKKFNMKLSKNRVKAVQKYLVDRGILKSRIEIDWKGEKEPLVDEKTSESIAKIEE